MDKRIETNGNTSSESKFRGSSLTRNRSRSPMNNKRSRSRSPAGTGREGNRNIRRNRSREGDRRSGNVAENRRMAYISNIPYEMRWMDLKDLIREKAGDVSFVEMIEKDGRSKGCAVVEFKNHDGLTKCLENMNKLEVEDRKLVVKEIRDPEAFFRKVREETGVDFLAHHRGGGGSSGTRNANIPSTPVNPFGCETYGLSPTFLHQLGIDGPLSNRVFVANLPFHLSSGKIKEVFDLAGQVIEVDLHLDKDGKSKGISVIEYFHPIEAVQAISMMHHQKLYDRQMIVKMDRFEKAQDPLRPGDLPAGLVGVGMGLGANGSPLTNVGQLVASGQFGPTTPFIANGTSNTLGSLSSSVLGVANNTSNIARFSDPIAPSHDFTGSLGGALAANRLNLSNLTMSSIEQAGGRVYTNAAPTSQVAPSVDFMAAGSALRSPYSDVISRDREYGSRNLGGASGGINSSAFYDQPRSGSPLSKQYVSSLNPSGLLYGSSNIGGTDVFSGRSLNDFDRYGSIRTSRSITIRNLPLDYSWQTLRDRMRGFGDVDFADIIQPGVGKIRFKSASDAEKATVALHGMHVEGRAINVDLTND